jgi:class 3 adenylate cyclase/CHAT domain-containing protein
MENKPDHTPRNIDELLRQRRELDTELRDKYSREVTILFTDIKGSTQFFEKRGDLEGRAMVQAHNDLLFPIVEKHGGTVIKTIGDAIMASFQLPSDAVASAIEMQRSLECHNRDTNAGEGISVRIGINHGTGLVETNDVFGDVVNVAARIESLADGGEILVSETVYNAVRYSDDVILRYRSDAEVKGKSEPIKLYSAAWNDDLVCSVSGNAFSSYSIRGKAGDEKVFTLEFSREGETVKLSAIEKELGQEKTLRHFEEKPLPADKLDSLCKKTTQLLNRANKRGKVAKEIFAQLKEVGQQLYDMLITPKAREALSNTEAASLIISMDDNLIQVPWEIMFDGKDFLCLRFAMGRVVSTRQSMGAVKTRDIQHPLKMLVLSDPKGDLKASYSEGRSIRDELDKLSDYISANLKSGPINTEYVSGKMRSYDVLHYAGHADYDVNDPSNSGWLLSDGKLTAREILDMAGGKPMPSLVFSNACHSGQTEEWSITDGFGDEIYGLANAFLRSGVQHYIGTFWEVLDEPSELFAVRFYVELMQGASVGEAARLARLHLIEKYGENNIVWSSYMLYGDPTFMYFKGLPAIAEAAEAVTESEDEREYALAGTSTRSHADAMPNQAGMGGARPAWQIYTVFLAAAVGLAILSYALYGGKTLGDNALTASTTPHASVATNPTPSSGADGLAALALASKADADKAQADTAKKQNVRELAKSLVARYREQQATGASSAIASDGPMTIAFLDFDTKGDGPEGEGGFLLSAVQDKVIESGKARVVERELLDEVLAELELSSSDLADKSTQLALGRILSARYIATGSMYRYGDEYRVSMRMIETETTAIKATSSGSGKGPLDVEAISGRIAGELTAKLAE